MPKRRIPFDLTTPCILSTGYVHKKSGYARTHNGQNIARFLYAKEVGKIPKGWHVDHGCFNLLCKNVKHFRVLPAQVNRRLQRSTFKTHCKSGHLFTGNNLLRRKSGGRDCRACNLAAVRRYQLRKKANEVVA